MNDTKYSMLGALTFVFMSVILLFAPSGSAVAEEEPNTDVIQWALDSVNYETFEAKHAYASDGAQIAKRGGSISLLNGPLRGTYTAISPGVVLILR